MAIVFAVFLLVAVIIGMARKRKSEEKAVTIHRINFDIYEKSLITKGFAIDQLKKAIQEHLEMCEEPIDVEDFEIEAKADTQWWWIKCPHMISFYSFHNLIGWLTCDNPSKGIKEVYGLAKHQQDDWQSYYAHRDKDNRWGDTVIGVLNSSQAFSIYLPESYEEEGNMVFSKQGITTVGIRNLYQELGID